MLDYFTYLGLDLPSIYTKQVKVNTDINRMVLSIGRGISNIDWNYADDKVIIDANPIRMR